jgi:hypothetical protein
MNANVRAFLAQYYPLDLQKLADLEAMRAEIDAEIQYRLQEAMI